MPPDHLTYQWLAPVMMSIIAFLIGVIGFMIRGYLSSIDKNIEKVKDDLIIHVEKVEIFIKETTDRYNGVDKRVTRLEDHITTR